MRNERGGIPADVFPDATVIAHVAGMDRQEWLRLRRGGIGGSDAAAVVGLNPWSSPYEVWADKRGLLPDKEETEAMRLGNYLEDYVARRFAEETGKNVRAYKYMLGSVRYPWARADIDRRIVGENAGLECKTTRIHGTGKRGYPDHYYAQCMHYIAVTGADRWYLAILNLADGTFTWHVVERNEEDIAALMAADGRMWGSIQSGTPPEMDGSDATDGALGAIYGESTPGSAADLRHHAGALKEILALRKDKEVIETREKQLIQAIKLDLADRETGDCGVAGSVSWITQSRRSIDIDGMLRAGIDVSPYITETTSRVFRIKERS